MRDIFQKPNRLNSELDDGGTFEFDLPDDEFELLESWHFAQETHGYEIASLAGKFFEPRSY